RRLAAIVATDVVGYTHLMAADEVGTLAALRDHRAALIDDLIASHGGRIVKTMGDGLLLEYPSVVSAVESMLAVQTGMIERNAEVAEATRIVLRVGINLGDIIIDGDDIHGDGVNLAARLEAMASPGGIAISDIVHGQIRNRLAPAFIDDGEHDLKGIAHPIRIWHWNPGEQTQSVPPILTEPDKPSIAVLPFNNMSGDVEQEYFSDGMTEDIITDLSKASQLFVIARNSSFAYKGQSPDIRQVCRELGVRYVLEGSVRRAGNRVRISAQLINGSDGGHIWAERYDRDLEDIFAVQDEVTREIVAALQVELTPEEQDRRQVPTKVDPAAYDFFYRARSYMFKFTPQSMIKCRAMLDKALELDPAMALAHALYAIVYATEYLNGWKGVDASPLDKAYAFAERACELDNENALAHTALSLCQTWRGELGLAVKSAARSVELDPNFGMGYSALGQACDFLGLHENAIEAFQMTLRLDPQHDLSLHFIGRAQFAMGRDVEAEENFKRRLAIKPDTDTTRAYLAALYGANGRLEEAREIWRELMEINPDFDAGRIRNTLPYTVSTWFDRFYGGLEKAGLLK
ncbi:MAG: adenylate/guanylate cyclase domain-containing protein, partial [Rhodospirillaceae bacterium]|nr:adenylate/guanylate cyclase domain-containing protein [Rhodospirillaceae bacterium]